MTNKLKELLGQYWDAALLEGYSSRSHDTEDDIAQRLFSEIHEEITYMVLIEREACANICDNLHNTWKFDDTFDSTSGPRECALGIRAR